MRIFSGILLKQQTQFSLLSVLPFLLLIYSTISYGDYMNSSPNTSIQFECKHEQALWPAQDHEANEWYKKARKLQKNQEPWVENVDYEQIGHLYRQAITRNHIKSNYNLQYLLLTKQVKPQEGMKQIEEIHVLNKYLLDNEIPIGYALMAEYLNRGIGVDQDEDEAYRFLREAAVRGNAQAQYVIGDIYVSKKAQVGVAKWVDNPAYHPELGMKMLQCAVEQGHGEAGDRLAFLSKKQKKYDDALKYYQLAASNGHGTSLTSLIYAFTITDPTDGFYLAQSPDPERVKRYEIMRNILHFNEYARFPDIDKIVPLPPAELPEWDETFEFQKSDYPGDDGNTGF